MAIVESTGQLAFLCGDDDFDTPLLMDKTLKTFPSIRLTSKYNDCHVYAIRHKALQQLNKSKWVFDINTRVFLKIFPGIFLRSKQTLSHI